MKIVLVCGTNYKGTTYHYARMIAEGLKGEIREFFLPRDFGEYCLGCSLCLYKGEQFCPHATKLAEITKAMDEADILIFASPTFVYHVTGAMKSFLDHYGWRWMLHRPDERYFHKIGIAVSTCAGGGADSTCQDMADSFFYWGMARIYQLPLKVYSTNLAQVTPKTEASAKKKVARLVEQVAKVKDPKPLPKTRAFFRLANFIHHHNKTWDPYDLAYWKEKGWDQGKHPW